ncbi:MAG: methyl-accepting chemotaxis protein [Firmicutes bacterium]|nr:methyl-accepting chemotaxis protein [Bacillota bacterium]
MKKKYSKTKTKVSGGFKVPSGKKKDIFEKGKRLISLRVTLGLAFLALSAVLLIITGSLNMYNNFSTNKKVVTDQQELIAKDAANIVKSYIQEKLGKLEVAAAIGDLDSTTYEEQKLVFEMLFGLEPAFRQLFLLDHQGKELCKISRLSKQAITKAMEDHKREVFESSKSAKSYSSSVYIDDTTFEPMMIMAVSIHDFFGNTKGIIMAEVNLKFMWDLVGSLEIGKKGQAYVVDRMGNLIAARDVGRVLKGENLVQVEKVAQFLNNRGSRLASKAETMKGIDDHTVVISYVPLVNPDWAVMVELPISEAYEPVRVTFIISLLILVFSFGLAVLVGSYISGRITKPLVHLRDATKTISAGNLNTRINIESENEIGELAYNFNQMVGSLGNLIVNTKQAIQLLLEQSAALRDGSNQSVQTSEAIAVAMQQISQGTSDQTIETEKTANQMTQLANEIDFVVSNANVVEKITSHAKELSLKSKEAINLLTQKATENEALAGMIAKNINEFIISMEKIQNVTGMISDITEQTNLLALNAAIEAARAGEAGRGFAIVAEEMNKLAGQSRDAARTINDMIVGIHDQTVASASSSDQAHLLVKEQMTSVLSARDAFDEIVGAMDGIIERNVDMISTIKKMNDYKEMTVNSIMTISSVSEETAASSEEVLASTEEQTALAEQIRDLADRMHVLAENLVLITNSFVIDEEQYYKGA